MTSVLSTERDERFMYAGPISDGLAEPVCDTSSEVATEEDAEELSEVERVASAGISGRESMERVHIDAVSMERYEEPVEEVPSSFEASNNGALTNSVDHAPNFLETSSSSMTGESCTVSPNHNVFSALPMIASHVQTRPPATAASVCSLPPTPSFVPRWPSLVPEYVPIFTFTEHMYLYIYF